MEEEYNSSESLITVEDITEAHDQLIYGTGKYQEYQENKNVIGQLRSQAEHADEAEALRLNAQADNLETTNDAFLVADIPIKELDDLYSLAVKSYRQSDTGYQHYEGLCQELENEYDVDRLDRMKPDEVVKYLQKKRLFETFRDQYLQERNTKASMLEHLTDLVKMKEAADEAVRKDDTTYVAETAIIQCSKGLRVSLLLVPNPHYTYAKGVPLCTIKDVVVDDNVVNFGGCTSFDNPKLDETVQTLIQELRDENNYIVEQEDTTKRDELKGMCACPCEPEFLGDWINGQENVLIDGGQPLLRRCELYCAKGGKITFRTSGQPE